MNINRLIQYAFKLDAECRRSTADHPRYRHFTFLLDKSRIVTIGRSRNRKTHPIAAKYGYRRSIHSELDAVLRLDKEGEANGLVMFNTQIVQGDRISMAKPCPICQRFIRDVGIRSVIYTNHDGDIIYGTVQ